jgi:hypothetical protein
MFADMGLKVIWILQVTVLGFGMILHFVVCTVYFAKDG